MQNEPTPDQLKKQNQDWIARAMMGEESLISLPEWSLGCLSSGFFAWLFD